MRAFQARLAPHPNLTDNIREVRVEVEPAWPFVLSRRASFDGLVRVQGGVLHRLLHDADEPVHVRVAQLSSGAVVLGAQSRHAATARNAIGRMRRALGIDQRLEPFHARFKHDPLIGAALRRDPTVRVRGRPSPFEALAWAVTEQLIESDRAAAIQRRLIARLGRACERTGLRDSPSAELLAQVAPALLQSFDLSAGRALALRRAAAEVASGRVDLDAPEPEAGWRRLRAIPGIGSWTVEMLAITGQGRLDQLPAGDLAFLKLAGRLASGGDPRARATEQEVRELFAPYAPWQGLAGVYALRADGLAVTSVAGP